MAVSISLTGIALLAFAIHGPILLMEFPASSLNANTHMFFAQHYADSWFNPWNEKWFSGFSQATFPPLAQQWVALFTKFMSVTLAYMFVQLCTVLLLTTGVFRYANLWVGENAAKIAALGSIFLGSLAMLVYQAGELPSTLATALMINAAVFFYAWIRKQGFVSLLAASLLTIAAVSAEYTTGLFGLPLFIVPLLFLAILDRKDEQRQDNESSPSFAGVVARTAVFAVLCASAIAIILAPFWATLVHPVPQLTLDDGSRANFLFAGASAINFWVAPMGAMILALPFVFIIGLGGRRLRPLFFAFYICLLIGLGGTTPVGRILLGSFYQNVNLLRFTFWATLLALPIAAVAAEAFIQRYSFKAVVALTIACVVTLSLPFMWMVGHPNNPNPLRVEYMVSFLNRDFHNRYRYITLGFGTNFGEMSRLADAQTLDGAYTPGRLLPELAPFGSLRLDDAKAYGAPGMEALRALLKHANRYGLKYIFVRDRFYEPLIAFAGWRQIDSYENGNVTLWGKEDIPTMQPADPPPALGGFQRIAWGILPMLSCILGLGLLCFSQARRSAMASDSANSKTVYLREAK